VSSTFRTSAPRRQQTEPSPAPDTIDTLTRELRSLSFEERDVVMRGLRADLIANGRRESGKPRPCSCTSARTAPAPAPTPTAAARVAASPVPAPPSTAMLNQRVQQMVAARPSPAAHTSPVPPTQSLIQRLRSAFAPPTAPGTPRTAKPQSRTAAGSGVPQPPNVNDRITGGVW
jgi:hypothetical protein